jgi:prepilin-type processing-associated H-X9-DG protein
LVVISIIALLLAVLLPTLQQVRQRAKAAGCQAKLRQWGAVLMMYVMDDAKLLPEFGESRRVFACIDAGYVKQEMLLCPIASRYEPRADGLTDVTCTVKYGSTFTPWKVDRFTGSYGWRGILPLVDSKSFAGRLRPVDTPLMYDCAYWDGTPGNCHDEPPAYEEALSDPPSMTPMCVNRHDGGINMVFCDISARKIGLKELWVVKWKPGWDTRGPWTKAGGVQPEDWPQWMRRFKDY